MGIMNLEKRTLIVLASFIAALLLARSQLPAHAQPQNVIEIKKEFYYPRRHARLNDLILFDARDRATGVPQLWRTDGTPEGTLKIRDFPEGIYNLQTAGNRVFLYIGHKYTAYKETLWTSDGTPGGTNLVTSQTFGKYTKEWSSVGDKLLFVGDDGIHGDELWTSDGTTAGTTLLFDHYPGIQGTSFYFGPELNGRRFFLPREKMENSYWQWTTDGTPEGTIRLGRTYYVGNSWAIANGSVYYWGSDSSGKDDGIWKSDGTPAGTQKTHVIYAGSQWKIYGTQSGDRFYFLTTGSPQNLYVTDGTQSGTRLLKTFSPELPMYWTTMGEKLLFFENEATDCKNVWITDGTAAGTSMLLGGLFDTFHMASRVGRVFFLAQTAPDSSIEAWSSNGTMAGTRRITPLFPQWTSENSTMYFFMDALGQRVPMIGSPSGGIEQNGTIFIFDPALAWNAARHWRLFE